MSSEQSVHQEFIPSGRPRLGRRILSQHVLDAQYPDTIKTKLLKKESDGTLTVQEVQANILQTQAIIEAAPSSESRLRFAALLVFLFALLLTFTSVNTASAQEGGEIPTQKSETVTYLENGAQLTETQYISADGTVYDIDGDTMKRADTSKVESEGRVTTPEAVRGPEGETYYSIHILYVLTPAAAEKLGGIERADQLLTLGIQNYNTNVFENAGSSSRYNKVGVKILPDFLEGPSQFGNIDDMKTDLRVLAWKTETGADSVQFITAPRTSTGDLIQPAGASETTGDSENSFSAFSTSGLIDPDTGLPKYMGEHEIYHDATNEGNAAHDGVVVETVDGRKQTVMNDDPIAQRISSPTTDAYPLIDSEGNEYPLLEPGMPNQLATLDLGIQETSGYAQSVDQITLIPPDDIVPANFPEGQITIEGIVKEANQATKIEIYEETGWRELIRDVEFIVGQDGKGTIIIDFVNDGDENTALVIRKDGAEPIIFYLNGDPEPNPTPTPPPTDNKLYLPTIQG